MQKKCHKCVVLSNCFETWPTNVKRVDPACGTGRADVNQGADF